MFQFNETALDIPQKELLSPGNARKMDKIQAEMYASVARAEQKIIGGGYGFTEDHDMTDKVSVSPVISRSR
jgi:hypothetical protein